MAQVPVDWHSCLSKPSFELPLFDGTNYAKWKPQMVSFFREMSPKIWWIVNVGFTHGSVDCPKTEAQKMCLFLEANAHGVLRSALSAGIYDQIENWESTHDMWVELQEKFEEPNMASDEGSTPNDDVDHNSKDAIEQITTPSTSSHCLMAEGNMESSSHGSHVDIHANNDSKQSYDKLVKLVECMKIHINEEESRMRILEEENSSLKSSLEDLKLSHESLSEAHEKLKESYDSLAPIALKNAKVDIGISCDLIDEMSTSNNELSCANPSCSQAKPSCDEHVCVETCDDLIASENDGLMMEVERLKARLNELERNGHEQPSQDNREHMVKKLEKGTTVSWTKSTSTHLKKNQPKKYNLRSRRKAHIKCFNCSLMGHYASECTMSKNGQDTSSRRQRSINDRRCYGCKEKGHNIASCQNKKVEQAWENRKFRFVKPEVPVSAEKLKSVKGKLEAKKTQKQSKASKIKHRICYTCRNKGHIGKECPFANFSNSKHVKCDDPLKAKNATCTSKVICSPMTSTKVIWVPRFVSTNSQGPNKCWVPKSA